MIFEAKINSSTADGLTSNLVAKLWPVGKSDEVFDTKDLKRPISILTPIPLCSKFQSKWNVGALLGEKFSPKTKLDPAI